eukprot:m.420474 g.420474  ORF g.420474 m.420474 type:complete len:56 (+) comp21318_c1_seq1:2964-3131(+)
MHHDRWSVGSQQTALLEATDGRATTTTSVLMRCDHFSKTPANETTVAYVRQSMLI